jgi:hypothetical protein
MSRSIDLFIDAEQPPDEVASAIGRLLGSDPVEDPDTGAWLLSQGDVEASLSEHRYVDEAHLPFTRFRYALSARVPNTVRLQDAPAAALLRQIADLTQRRLGWPALLVMDLQYRDQPVDPSGSLNEPDEADMEGEAAMTPGGVDLAPGDPGGDEEAGGGR